MITLALGDSDASVVFVSKCLSEGSTDGGRCCAAANTVNVGHADLVGTGITTRESKYTC